MTTLPHAAEYTDAHGAPHVPRVQITVGTRATFLLNRMVARFPALAGMQLKCEAADTVTGTVTGGGYVEGETTPEGKREVAFTVRCDDGATYELRRSWIVSADVAPDADATGATHA